MKAVVIPEGGGEFAPFNFVLVPLMPEEEMREHVRSSIARGLPHMKIFDPVDDVLSIVAGGPSLQDTWKQADGCIATVNQSLSFMLEKDVVPTFCGVCDPHEWMTDLVEADPRVTYFLASVVHPKLFDKLLNAGCKVILWHALSAIDDMAVMLDNFYGKGEWMPVGGGSTMGVRWFNLGYLAGFRKFKGFGLDSSFKEDAEWGRASHAYPDKQDKDEWLQFGGFWTKPSFIGQTFDFVGTMDRFTHADIDHVSVELFGDGLLQRYWHKWQEENPGWMNGGPRPGRIDDSFVWPRYDIKGAITQRLEVKRVEQFLQHTTGRGTAIQAGGAVGVYPAHLAQHFAKVVTFEADPMNYGCLLQNLAGIANVEIHNAALGSHPGTVSTYPHQAGDNGCIRVLEVDGGKVPMVMIDSLGLESCDLIWLDVEGYEEPALLGAARTIDKFKPPVIIEENELPLIHGLKVGGAASWLIKHGYKRLGAHGRDAMYVPC